MAYVPVDARRFLANLVEEIKVEGCRRNVVHINYVLIEASLPEEAYKRAVKLGKQANRVVRWPASAFAA